MSYKARYKTSDMQSSSFPHIQESGITRFSPKYEIAKYISVRLYNLITIMLVRKPFRYRDRTINKLNLIISRYIDYREGKTQ